MHFADEVAFHVASELLRPTICPRKFTFFRLFFRQKTYVFHPYIVGHKHCGGNTCAVPVLRRTCCPCLGGLAVSLLSLRRASPCGALYIFAIAFKVPSVWLSFRKCMAPGPWNYGVNLKWCQFTRWILLGVTCGRHAWTQLRGIPSPM